jgi:hypothetical protein
MGSGFLFTYAFWTTSVQYFLYFIVFKGKIRILEDMQEQKINSYSNLSH